jgi:hypothetical protein
VRRYWRGDDGHVPVMADRLTGSALQFDHSGRSATSSVNMLTAHDGFTLADVVSYVERHNEANGEDNRDGHSSNYSDNFGVEGPSKSAQVRAERALRRRNLIATLLLCQGTPMLLAGDEIGNSQGGNNNAYCQDNETGWIDWDNADGDFLEFTRKMIAFRRAHPILRQQRFLHAQRTGARRAGGPVLVAARRRADGAGGLGRSGGARPLRRASDGVGHAGLCRTGQCAVPRFQRRHRGCDRQASADAGWAGLVPPHRHDDRLVRKPAPGREPERPRSLGRGLRAGGQGWLIRCRRWRRMRESCRSTPTRRGDAGGPACATMRALLAALRLPVATEAEAVERLEALQAEDAARTLPRWWVAETDVAPRG